MDSSGAFIPTFDDWSRVLKQMFYQPIPGFMTGNGGHTLVEIIDILREYLEILEDVDNDD